MDRRQYIISLSAVTAGTGALLGSGAFTSVEADRDVTVEVAGDNRAFLRMTPVVHKIEGVDENEAPVFDENGLLGIDTSRGLAEGVNANATTWIGTPNPDNQSSWVEVEDDHIDWIGDHTYTPRAAFGFENRGTQEYDLTFEYEYEGDPGDSEITFEFYDGAAPALGSDFPREIGTLEGEGSVGVDAGAGNESFTLGKRIFGSIKIVTGSTGDDLSGTLTIIAEAPT